MLSQFSYPIIYTDAFKKSVAFYEDYFEFTPELELNGFVILKRADRDEVYLGLIDVRHEALPACYRQPVQGLMLNYPVENVLKFYDYAYHEGLNLVSDPEDAPCGRKHFFIADPNGVLIDVAENIEVESLKDTSFVAVNA